MKVVGRDNWGRDYNGGRSETVAGENLDKDIAKRLAIVLNERFGGEFSDIYYTVQPDDYEPYIFDGY